jgi:Methyltransferase domain
MRRSFALYRVMGHRFVQGWLKPEVLDITRTLDAAQRRNDVSGAVAEIGVHQGKFFIGLHLLLHEKWRSLAIDVFADQHLNIDRSGRGDLDTFLANINRWASPDGLVIHQGDSTLLDSTAVQELAGSSVRLFSVDGGHTEQIVLADMELAETSLTPGGVVIADDVFNEMWPGVAVGTLRYLQNGAALAPFAIGFNKVFFAQPEYIAIYRGALESKYNKTAGIGVNNSIYAGHEVTMLFRTPRTPRRLLRKNATARALYRRWVRGEIGTPPPVTSVPAAPSASAGHGRVGGHGGRIRHGAGARRDVRSLPRMAEPN